MPKVTWKGEPGAPDSIEQYGVTFTRGTAVDVADDHPQLRKFKGNPQFEVDGAGSSAPPLGSDDDSDQPFTAVHKGRGKWVVEGPDGTLDAGPFDKDEAKAYADKANADAAKAAAEAPAAPAGAATS